MEDGQGKKSLAAGLPAADSDICSGRGLGSGFPKQGGGYYGTCGERLINDGIIVDFIRRIPYNDAGGKRSVRWRCLAYWPDIIQLDIGK